YGPASLRLHVLLQRQDTSDAAPHWRHPCRNTTPAPSSCPFVGLPHPDPSISHTDVPCPSFLHKPIFTQLPPPNPATTLFDPGHRLSHTELVPAAIVRLKGLSASARLRAAADAVAALASGHLILFPTETSYVAAPNARGGGRADTLTRLWTYASGAVPP